MPELPYEHAFNTLIESYQPKEFHALLTTSKQLLDTAHHEHTLPEISQNPHLKRFTDAPGHVQSIWEIHRDDSVHHRDRLAINMGGNALWLSIGYSNLQPSRSLTIGSFYASVGEQHPVRAGSTDRVLRNDRDKDYWYNDAYVTAQLAQFALHLDTSLKLLSLTYAVQQEGSEVTPTSIPETFEEAA